MYRSSDEYGRGQFVPFRVLGSNLGKLKRLDHSISAPFGIVPLTLECGIVQ